MDLTFNNSAKLMDYLVCPDSSDRNHELKDCGDYLICSCGKKYSKINGIPALREVDVMRDKDYEISSKQSKYYDESFVGNFILRQYSHLVHINQDVPFKFDDRTFSRIMEIKGGGEIFYQTLLGLIGHYVKKNMTVLDLGCGTGRLTAEFARFGIDLAIGVDYSSLMVEKAANILSSEKGNSIGFKVRSSRSHLLDAKIDSCGFRNCGFLIADAQILPIRNYSIDIIACINVLHRVKEPRKVIENIERALKNDGILLMSNSYDWSEEYTAPELWFDDVTELMDKTTWKVENEIDGVLYITGIYNRKLSLTFNHVQVFRKIK